MFNIPRKELPPPKPYRENRDAIGWRFHDEIPHEFFGWRLIILDARRMSDDTTPADVPSLVIEEV